MGAHVAARWSVVAKDERRLQGEKHHQRGERNDGSGQRQLSATLDKDRRRGRHSGFGQRVVGQRVVGWQVRVRHMWGVTTSSLSQCKKSEPSGVKR